MSPPAPEARTGPDGLPESSVSSHADLPGLRARIGVAPAAHTGETWRTWSHLHQAPGSKTNAAPYGRHGPAGLTVDPVRFFLTMPLGVRWPLPWWNAQDAGLLVGDLNSWTDAADDEPPPLWDLDQGEHQGSNFSVASYLWQLATANPADSAASAAEPAWDLRPTTNRTHPAPAHAARSARPSLRLQVVEQYTTCATQTSTPGLACTATGLARRVRPTTLPPALRTR